MENSHLQEIMKRLGEAIGETIQDSERIQELLREMEEKGYTLSMSLAVIVGLGTAAGKQKREKRGSSTAKPLSSKTTAFDRKFLKALRIRVSEELP